MQHNGGAWSSSSETPRVGVLGLALVLVLVLVPVLVGSPPAAAQSALEEAVPTAADPIDFAIETSLLRFPDAGTADHAVLIDVGAVPDALSATVLSATGPLLMTAPDALDALVETELQRVLAAGDTVYLIGGEEKVAAAVDADLTAAGLTPVRLSGESRIETAIAVAEEAMRIYGAPDQVALVRADGPADDPTAAWADAATTGGWAASSRQPVLLTATDVLHPDVERWIADRRGIEVAVIGGTDAISQTVLRDVDAIGAATGEVTRVSGVNRYATATAIADALWVAPRPARMLLRLDLTDGWTFALSAAGLSADRRQPLLGVEQQRLPDETRDEICGGRDVSLLFPADQVDPVLSDALGRSCPR